MEGNHLKVIKNNLIKYYGEHLEKITFREKMDTCDGVLVKHLGMESP